MKKSILLFLIIAISFGLAISESSKKPLLERVEKDGYSKQLKDSLWEYVKKEVGEGKIDLNIKYQKKYKDPILFILKSATPSDSLAIETLMRELKLVFPLKKVAYYSDFARKSYKKLNRDSESNIEKKTQLSNLDQLDDDLISFTTELSFGYPSVHTGTTSSGFNLKSYGADNIKARKNKWNKFFFGTEIFFSFTKDITVENKTNFIKYHFLKAFWKTHTENFIGGLSDFRRQQSYFTGNYWPVSFKLVGADYLKNYEFLLSKIFSNDFKKQFEDYMYKTYPWRYANYFLDKDLAKQNAISIVIFVGLLILILSCSLFWNKKFKYSLLNYFLPIFIYTTSFVSLNMLYTYLIHIDYINNAVSGIVGSFVFTSLIAVVLSFLFWQIEKRIISNKLSFGSQLIIKSLLTFLFLYLPYILIYLLFFFNKEGETSRYVNDLQFLFLAIGLTLGRGLLIYLNHFSDSLVKEKEVELSRLKEVNAQSELKLLQSHINPHFLYNALNSIAGLAHDDADKTEKMALSLSDLFRYSINKKGEKMSTVNEEVTMVQNYLDIEKIRFGNRLQFSLQVEELMKEEKIPMYMLQPLIENAIKHGVSKIGGEAKVGLEIKKEKENFLITVSDNGPDFPKGLVSGHGLQTVYDLLRLSYGSKASLSWENTPEKKIIIAIKNNN